MHYKCYLYSMHHLEREDINEILFPFWDDRIKDNGITGYEKNLKFIYTSFEIGGPFKYYRGGRLIWNGCSTPLVGIKAIYKWCGEEFEPGKCQISMDNSGRIIVRDEFPIRIENCSRPDFVEAARTMADDYRDGFVTLLDICNHGGIE